MSNDNEKFRRLEEERKRQEEFNRQREEELRRINEERKRQQDLNDEIKKGRPRDQRPDEDD